MQNINFYWCILFALKKQVQPQVSSWLFPISFQWAILIIFALVYDSAWEYLCVIQVYPAYKHKLLFFSNCISHRLSQTLSRVFYLGPRPKCLQSNVAMLALLAFLTLRGNPCDLHRWLISSHHERIFCHGHFLFLHHHARTLCSTLTVALQSHLSWVLVLLYFGLFDLLFQEEARMSCGELRVGTK